MLFSIYIGLVTEESKAYWENQLKYFAFKTFAEVRYVNMYIHICTYLYVLYIVFPEALSLRTSYPPVGYSKLQCIAQYSKCLSLS